MKKMLLAICCVGFMLHSAFAHAGGREALYHQGFVTDQRANPLNGTMPVTFRIYAAASGGEPLWEERDAITFDNGAYSTELGDATAFPSALFDRTSLYLSVQVEGDTEMNPRLMLSSVPWAHQADVAITAQSLADDAVQDRVMINGIGEVIDRNGQWVGSTAGLAGPTGAAGPAGPIGPIGPQGIKGDTGAIGPQGVKGDAGSIGLSGAQGERGETGPVGPAGTRGEQGATGAIGAPGIKGDTGAVGAQGEKGDSGIAGAQGPQGLRGDTGPIGLTGATGNPGATGPAGPQGLKGDLGAQGIKGDTGATGAQGAQGLQGDVGPQGLPGVKGDTGDAAPSIADYAFAFDTTTQRVALANAFQDITFDTNAYLNGWQHTAGAAVFTCTRTGLYRVDYRALVNGGIDILSLRAMLNGAEIPGSQSSLAGTGINAPLTQSFLAQISAGANLTFQLTGNTALNQQLSGNHGAGNIAPSMTLTITRIQ